MTDAQLRRLQWAVRATLTLGVAASVTANVLHAKPNLIAQAIAAWPPLALLITVELVSRIPVYRKALGVVRIVSTCVIAAIAAWVSYHHMMGVVARYGETGTVPYLLPLSVDGLIVVASVSLVELAGRRRDTSAPADLPASATTSTAIPATEPASNDAELVAARLGELVSVGSRTADRPPSPAPWSAVHLASDDPDVGHDDAEDDPRGAVAADLIPLLSAARDARDELIGENRPVSRDALARRMRLNGHSIRTARVSELLNALRREDTPAHDRRPAPTNGHGAAV
jgi:hypothetical protein